jgi:glucosamine--fructose-6-phosphate aminotransferase (isomerizing)
MSDKEPEKIAGVRNGPPLLVGLGKDENFIASDVQAILHRTNRIVYLNDNEFALCTQNSVELFTEKGAPLPLKISQLDWSAEQMDKQGYRHYMLKEIYEQSLAVANTIAGNIDARVGVVSLPEWFKAPSLLKNTERISLVACGTAKHAALVGKYYLEKMAGIPVDVDFASEFRYRNPILDPKTLLISVSQSGGTADTLAAQREGKQKKVPTLAICNVRHSTLAREADFVIYTNAGPEIGVASTKAFTTQLTVLYLLAVQLGLEKGTLKLEQAQALTSDLRKLPHLIDNTNKKGKAKVAVETINACLDLVDKANSFLKIEYLSLALRVPGLVSDLHLRNTATGERLVQYSARHGMIGMFPDLPKKLLGREMTGEEVKLLVTAYTNDHASQCSSTEDKLKALAKRFLNREDAGVLIKQVEDFERDFKNRIDW